MININFHLVFLSLLHLSYITAFPNIVIILADDLDLVLDGMTPLKNTVDLIGKKGATYTNCIVADPVCCPNRASILTGRYVHNHLTINNSIEGNCNSDYWQQTHEPYTFAAHLKNLRDYETFYAGKYLNQYGRRNANGPQHIPPGWEHWYALVGNSVYYHYALSINGTKTSFGNSSNDYLTDVLNSFAVNFINSQSKNQPFLMFVSPPAPHAPFTPADRHIGTYKGIRAKRTKNFNVMPRQDKHWLLRMGPTPLPQSILPTLDDVFRRRWESLLAVDELVLAIIEALEQKDFLDNTYIIFTSDNGYHIGQFGLTVDKNLPYETDIRIPFLIRGPGIQAGIEKTEPISSVDIFPTILMIAGLERPSDGTSIFNQNLSKDRTLLIEHIGDGKRIYDQSLCPNSADINLAECLPQYVCKCQDARNNTYSCIRRISEDINNLFCIFYDSEHFIEAYDLRKDSDQMENIAYIMEQGMRYRFQKRLENIRKCYGANCIFSESRYRNTTYMHVVPNM